jgi:thioredoxin-related protein
MSPFLITYVLLWVLVAALSVGVFALYHHFGQMYLNSREGRAGQGPEVNTVVPALSGTDLHGEEVAIPPPNQPSLLVFVTTNCRLCSDLLEDVRNFAEQRDDLQTVVIYGDPPSRVAARVNGLGSVATVISDPKRSISARYRIQAAPFLVAVDSEGVVQTKGIINNRDGLEYGADALARPRTTTA